jgi:hypothetical protein
MAPKRPFSELEWNLTPEPIRHYILYLEKLVSDMARRIEAYLTARVARIDCDQCGVKMVSVPW